MSSPWEIYGELLPLELLLNYQPAPLVVETLQLEPKKARFVARPLPPAARPSLRRRAPPSGGAPLPHASAPTCRPHPA